MTKSFFKYLLMQVWGNKRICWYPFSHLISSRPAEYVSITVADKKEN